MFDSSHVMLTPTEKLPPREGLSQLKSRSLRKANSLHFQLPKDLPPVKELSHQATAMTSPQASTTEVVDAMATATDNDMPNHNLQLTAIDDTESPKPQTDEAPPEDLPAMQQNNIMGDVGGELRADLGQRADLDGLPIQIQNNQFGPANLPANMAQIDPFNPLILQGQQGSLYDQNLLDQMIHQLNVEQMVNEGHFPQQILGPSPMIPENPEPEETRISAYAKLEFPDGEFYMNTHAIVLGRDLQAARAAQRRDTADQAVSQDPRTPVRVKEESRYSKSVVSESGGILREQDDLDEDMHLRRRKRGPKASKKSRSTGSSSQHQSRRNSLAQPNGLIMYQTQSQIRHPKDDGPAPVDPAKLRPSPYDCPTVGIHPPASSSASTYKAISRQHVKIAFSSDKHLFEAEIIGRNGAFIDDRFCHKGEIQELRSGSQLQIGGVVVTFVLPDVALGQTGAEQMDDDEMVVPDRYSEGGKEMSFDFEDAPRNGVDLNDTSDEVSEEGSADEDQDEEEGEDSGMDEEDEGDIRQSIEPLDGEMEEDEEEEVEEKQPLNSLPDPPLKSEKKRGPGRPPKNGIMSKREQQLAKKEALAQQKAKKSVPDSAPVPEKKGVGRPRKHPKPDTPPVQKEKRKYTKRKPKDPNAPQDGSGAEAKVKKEKKPPREEQSPSPDVKESDFTPEQLQKPNANYVVLIYDALSESKSGELSLPEIYRAIARKYPYFKFKVQTTGWQSSVRHNLSQHGAFKKGEKDGKGYKWGLVPGINVEKEKKKRATPPPQIRQGNMQPQPIYQAGFPPYMGPGQYPMPPPGYQYNPHIPPNTQPGQPASQYMMQPQQMSYAPPPGPNSHIGGGPPPGFAPPLPPQLAPPNGATYSSPYAPKPLASTTPQPNNQQPPVSQPPAPNPAPAVIPQFHQLPQQPLETQQSRQPQQPQQPQPNPPPKQEPPNESVVLFIEKFKATLVSSMISRNKDAESIVVSAANRLLGLSTASTVPDHHKDEEDKVFGAMKDAVSKVTGSNVNPTNTASFPPQQTDPRPPQPQPLANQNETQRNATPQPTNNSIPPNNTDKPASIMRPSFTGQGKARPNGPGMARPPMGTPGLNRTSSASPANAPPRQSAPPAASASPAATPMAATTTTTNGASTPTSISKTLAVGSDIGNGQLTGQKRGLEEDGDERDYKRLNLGATPQKFEN